MSSGPDEALAAHELDLVSRAAKGDAAAFDRFYERNAPAVQLLVERLLGPGETADGVVIEAFEKTVRRLPLLGARNSSPALYVLSTARNGAYAALGRGRPTAEGGPLAALLALPSRQRELLALRELGLPAKDCAEVAGIDAGEVGVQVARARLRLTDGLEGATLSTVFADDRAERLLAAEVVRVEGQPLPESLGQEIASHADGDARFAAALSAVRSPSRSVGQLPPVTGPARLAASTRERAVGPAATAGGAAIGLAGAASASALRPAATPDPSPRATPGKVDPYDEQIGDEVAWGIVDDDRDGGEAFQAGATGAGTPAVDAPGDGVWEDGAGAVSGEEPTEIAPRGGSGMLPPPLLPATPATPAASEGADPGLTDPFAGWDDALDWDDEEREWAAGPGADSPSRGLDLEKYPEAGGPGEDDTIVAPGVAGGAAGLGAAAAEAAEHSSGTPLAPREPADLGETRAFDAVAAGLVDPEPFEAYDYVDEDHDHAPRRSRLRWLIWVLAFAVLFAGVAFAAFKIASASQDPELPPASTLDGSTPRSTPTPTPKPSTSTKKSSSSSSSSKSSGDSASSTPAGGTRGSASTSTGGSTSGTTGGSGAGSGTSSGSGSGSTKKSTTTSGATRAPSGNATPTGAAADGGQVVSPGESTTGGAVRGGSDDATGGTTP